MKRCPNCGSPYTNDQQKFCTKDGTPLVDAQIPGAGQGETIRIDSAQLNVPPVDDEPTKAISRDLTPNAPAAFDPYKTIINPSPGTSASLPRDTQDLPSPPVSQPLPPSSSGSIQPPPPPSGSLPPSSSGPIQPPPVQQPQPQPSGQIATPPPPAQKFTPMHAAAIAPQPRKKSKLPMVLGILLVLFVIVIGAAGAGYWFVLRPMMDKRRVVINEVPPPTPTPIARSTPEPTKEVVKEVPPYSPPADAVQFVNSAANLDGKLKEHYVDFSFYYPNSWEKDPKAGVAGASNFAKVERRLPPDFTQENFAVGWYSSAGSEEGDRAVFHSLAENLSAQFAKGFTDYKKVSEGPTKAGPYDGYEFRFQSSSRNTERGDITIWGRVIFLTPVDGGKNGATLLMLATSLATELKSVNDVGVKGGLPMMLESFRFGK